MWHPFEKKWGQALKAHAQYYLSITWNAARGTWNTDNLTKLHNVGFGREVAALCGFCSTQAGFYHGDPRQNLQLQGLPRFSPLLLTDAEKGLMEPSARCGFAGCTESRFSKKDHDEVLSTEGRICQFHRDLCETLGR